MSMNLCVAEVPLSDIDRIEIYINSAKKSVATIRKETGADYVLNGTLYNMRTGAVNCHLKIDGKVIANPDYAAYPYTWDIGPDIVLGRVPGPTKRNHIACTLLIKDGKPEKTLYYDPGQGGSRGRSAIGIKDDRLALYCSKDGTSTKKTPEQLRSYLASAGWDSAIMLDGGGSSQCDFAGERVVSTRRVQHLILVYTKNGTCPYCEPTSIVRQGTKGTFAKWVQWHLNKHGASLTIDGDFGPNSVAALKAFQKSKRLTADGLCGAATRRALKKY